MILGDGFGLVLNDGHVQSYISLGATSNLVANHGFAGGISGLTGASQIQNSGTIGYAGSVAIQLGNFGDAVSNYGTLAGATELGGGDDVFDGTAGLQNGVVAGGAGNDTLNGGEGIDQFYGNGESDILRGRGGDDTLNGGLGNDTLKGGGGDDVFDFNEALNGSTNVDTIKDFKVDHDMFELSKAIFAKAKLGVLTEDQFYASTSGKAHDKSDRIIYETDTGKLIYDSNGNKSGHATVFAIIDKGLELHAHNFEIV